MLITKTRPKSVVFFLALFLLWLFFKLVAVSLIAIAAYDWLISHLCSEKRLENDNFLGSPKHGPFWCFFWGYTTNSLCNSERNVSKNTSNLAASLMEPCWTFMIVYGYSPVMIFQEKHPKKETKDIWFYHEICGGFLWFHLVSCSLTNDGSMVLLYMALHGSHQYTP